MFTRFKAGDHEYLMNQSGPMVRIPPETPGSEFLATLGRAYQQHIPVSRVRLLESARQLHSFVSANRHLLAFRYSFTVGMPIGRARVVRKGSGGCSGFTIGGKQHCIWGGNGECRLERMEVREDGTSYAAERIDVRDRKAIATDDWGEIKISRRKIEFLLPTHLAACISFLEPISHATIFVHSFDKPPTLRELVREFGEGSGGDDWAIEEVGRNGSHWHSELLAALTDRRFSKDRASIVQLLLICFPDAETRTAVVNAIRNCPPKAQEEVLMLLAAYQSQ